MFRKLKFSTEAHATLYPEGRKVFIARKRRGRPEYLLSEGRSTVKLVVSFSSSELKDLVSKGFVEEAVEIAKRLDALAQKALGRRIVLLEDGTVLVVNTRRSLIRSLALYLKAKIL